MVYTLICRILHVEYIKLKEFASGFEHNIQYSGYNINS